MSALGLTRAQALALAVDRNLSVTAGAGTGKTRVLTQRFLRILSLFDKKDIWSGGGARPSQVVAVTFTRKAANEMRERVTKEVGRHVRAAQDSGDEEVFAFWVQVRRELEEATIQTIHGLAARLVRLSALELGVDPKFRIVEGIDQRIMEEEAIAAVVRDPPEAAVRRMRELYVLRDPSQVRKLLRGLLKDRVHADAWAAWMLEQGAEGALEWVWRHLVPMDEAESLELIERVQQIHDDLVDRVRVQPDEEAKAHRLLGLMRACVDGADDHRLRTLALWCLLDHCTSGKGEWYKSAHHAVGPAREWDAMGLSGEGKGVFERLEAVLSPLVGRLDGVPDASDKAMLGLMESLALVYRALVQRYNRMKRHRGLVDYHDLEVLATRALSRPGVADSLRRHMRYLLVDEFQDTNAHQWEILRALACQPHDRVFDVPGGAGEDPSVAGDAWASAEQLESVPMASKGPGHKKAGGEEEEDKDVAEDDGPLRLVELESGDLLEQEELGEDRLFIVGDAKQSIYAFRGADVAVYEESRQAVRAANRHHGLDQEPPELQDVEGAPDPSSLTHLEREGEIALDRNFRSLPGLVEFTNRFFDRLMAVEDPEGGRRRFEAEPGPLVPHRKTLAEQADAADLMFPEPMRNGRVRLLVTPYGLEDAVRREDLSADQADRLGRVRFQFARMVQDIRDRVEGEDAQARWCVASDKKDEKGRQIPRAAQYKDVAVLLPRRTNLRLLEEQFRFHGVPYVVVGGRGFWSKQEVFDAVNLLAVVAEPQRDVELFSVLRSAFFSWSDEALVLLSQVKGWDLWSRLRKIAAGKAQWSPPESFQGVPPEEVVELLSRWRRRSRATPAGRLLMEILAETPYLAALRSHEPESSGRLGVENLEKLVELIRGLERRRGVNLVPLVRDLLALCEEDAEEAEAVLPGEDEQGVRVMTVHAAKGLEFPVVYVAELDAQIQPGSLGDAKGVDFETIHGVPLYGMRARGEDGEPADPYVYRAIRKRSRVRQRAEYKRVLYVAATRAEDHLVLVGSSKRLGPERGRSPPALKPVSMGNSWMDWVERILGLSPEGYEDLLATPGRCRDLRLEAEGRPPAAVEVDVGVPDLHELEELTAKDRLEEGPLVDEHEGVRLQPPLVPGPPAAVRVSPSQLLVYAQCQARFRYRVVEQMSEGWIQGVRSAAPSYGEAFGSLLHRTLAEGATMDALVPANIERRARAMAARYKGEGWPEADTLVAHLREHARRTLEALATGVDPTAVLVESSVDAELVPGLQVVGRLDRVHRDEQGRLVVVDLKTDTLSGKDEREHAAEHGHDAQVLLYDAALRQAGFETAEPALLYSSTGRLVRIAREEAADGGVIEELADRVQRTREMQVQIARGDDADSQGGPVDGLDGLEALWPRTARDVRVCRGCGFWRGNGGPCGGVG